LKYKKTRPVIIVAPVEVLRATEPSLYKLLDRHHETLIEGYDIALKRNSRNARIPLRLTILMYNTRNYISDGFLPVALGIFALVVILGHINLAWIQAYLPSFKTLSNSH
jgi:hypothetical protein